MARYVPELVVLAYLASTVSIVVVYFKDQRQCSELLAELPTRAAAMTSSTTSLPGVITTSNNNR